MATQTRQTRQSGSGLTGVARWFGWCRAFWRMFRDPHTPRRSKWLLVGLAALYLFSPVDLVPEAVTGPLGLLDDAVLVPLLLWLVTRLAPVWVRRRAYEEAGLGGADDAASGEEAR